MVLIITNKDDIVSDIVLLEVERRDVEVLRLNCEDQFDVDVDFACDSEPTWTIIQGKRRIRSDQVSGVWYRRPGSPRPLTSIGGEDEFVNDQWSTLIKGLHAASGPLWINEPTPTLAAENKILQLATAAKCGLRIPSTRITNRAEIVRAFVSANGGRAAIKALDRPWLENTEEFVFTSVIDEQMTPGADEARIAPFIVQQLMMPKADIRATVVGTQVFAAEANVDDIDWRLSEMPNVWKPCSLPTSVESSLVHLCRRLGLMYGAIDIVRWEGRYVFLEINPNGEWSWIQAETGLDIAGAIADALINPSAMAVRSQEPLAPP